MYIEYRGPGAGFIEALIADHDELINTRLGDVLPDIFLLAVGVIVVVMLVAG